MGKRGVSWLKLPHGEIPARKTGATLFDDNRDACRAVCDRLDCVLGKGATPIFGMFWGCCFVFQNNLEML